MRPLPLAFLLSAACAPGKSGAPSDDATAPDAATDTALEHVGDADADTDTDADADPDTGSPCEDTGTETEIAGDPYDGTVAVTYSEGDYGRSCEGPVTLGLGADGTLTGNVDCTRSGADIPKFSGPVNGTVAADGAVDALWVVTGVSECGPFDMHLDGTITGGVATLTFGWNDIAGTMDATLR